MGKEINKLNEIYFRYIKRGFIPREVIKILNIKNKTLWYYKNIKDH